MKTLLFSGALYVSIAIGASGQSANPTASSNAPSPTGYSVSRRDANSCTWERITYEQGSSGQPVPHLHRYVELAPGMHYKDPQNGNWTESSELIDILSDGTAVARHGQHNVHFPSDIYSGVIQLTTADGAVLRSRPIGLSYFDGTNSVFIADLTNSVGLVVGSNQVIYTNCFTDLAADLVYTYRRGGFEQDVVLRGRPSAPATYGLNPETCRLQLLTEFFNTANPIEVNKLATPTGLKDSTLQFGGMRMVRGRAFFIGQAPSPARANPFKGISVSKSWMQTQGRSFLIEEVPVGSIASELETLPVAPASAAIVSAKSLLHRTSRVRLLPPKRLANYQTKGVRMAKAEYPYRGGVVLDYNLVNIQTNDYTFQGDTTYFVSGEPLMTGTTTFEGGTVVKFDTSTTSYLFMGGPIDFKTGPYRPAVFTSMNDNSVGEAISGSTGVPTIQTNTWGVVLYTTAVTNVSALRFSYLEYGIVPIFNPVDICDCQFVQCADAIDDQQGSTTFLHNVLFDRCNAAIAFNDRANLPFTGEQVTAVVTNLWDTNHYVPGSLNFTNSIVVGNIKSGPTLNTNAFAANPAGAVFQSAVGGAYYLADDSPYRNTGTTNITTNVIADIAMKTTYAPVVYSNTMILAATTFSPQARRDTDVPDLGYHYDPLDYAFGEVISNANLTFTAGTAVGWFRTSSGYRSYGQPIIAVGLNMANSAIADFQGTGTLPDYWVRCNTVQENDTSAGYGPGGLTGSDDQYNQNISIAPMVHLNFTRCSVMAGEGNHFRDDWGYLVVKARNSEFWGGNCSGYVISCDLTNCLLDRTGAGQVEGWPGDEWVMRNCTWHGGHFYMSRSHTEIPVSIRDCSFDGTAVSAADNYSSDPTYTDYDFNAYTNATDPFPIGGSDDKASTVFNWQSGPLGSYYLPPDSLLIDGGDVTADQVGLYHFTTQTNQTSVEYNSQVDIGYHYLGVDGNNNPLDYDGDGIPDYIEDANGNGIVDSGETDWQNANDAGLTVHITRPRNGSTLP